MNYVSEFLRNFFEIYDGFFWEGEEMCQVKPAPTRESHFFPIKRMELALYGVRVCLPDNREINPDTDRYKSREGIGAGRQIGMSVDVLKPEIVVHLDGFEMFSDVYLPPHRASPLTIKFENKKHLRETKSISLSNLVVHLRFPQPTSIPFRRPLGQLFRKRSSHRLWESVPLIGRCDARIYIDADFFPEEQPLLPLQNRYPGVRRGVGGGGEEGVPLLDEESVARLIDHLFPHKKVGCGFCVCGFGGGCGVVWLGVGVFQYLTFFFSKTKKGERRNITFGGRRHSCHLKLFLVVRR